MYSALHLTQPLGSTYCLCLSLTSLLWLVGMLHHIPTRLFGCKLSLSAESVPLLHQQFSQSLFKFLDCSWVLSNSNCFCGFFPFLILFYCYFNEAWGGWRNQGVWAICDILLVIFSLKMLDFAFYEAVPVFLHTQSIAWVYKTRTVSLFLCTMGSIF